MYKNSNETTMTSTSVEKLRGERMKMKKNIGDPLVIGKNVFLGEEKLYWIHFVGKHKFIFGNDNKKRKNLH